MSGADNPRTVSPTGGVVPVSSPPVGAPHQWRGKVHQGELNRATVRAAPTTATGSLPAAVTVTR